MSKIVFLDTNIYLHYQPFDQINWLEVLKADAVTIIVPPITIRELNKRKDTPGRTRVRKRANLTIKNLSELFSSDSQACLRDGVNIRFEDRDPVIDFAAYQLNRDVQDDHLIASVIMYRNEMPEEEIVLVTSDAGLALVGKARRLEITAVRMPENYKLPDEPDLEQQQIRELEDQVRKLRHSIPELSLEFEGGSNHIEFTLHPPVEVAEKEFRRQLEEIKKRYPKKNKPPSEPQESDVSLIETMANFDLPLSIYYISSQDIAEYNSALDEFYEAYAAYLRDLLRLRNLGRRTVKLVVWLVNNGTAPAEDIDISMHFPDWLHLRLGFPRSPEEPSPPKLESEMQKLLSASVSSISAPLVVPPITPDSIGPSPNVSSFNIEPTGSYKVSFDVQKLKHKSRVPSDELYVVFNPFESAKSFSIDYKILAANIPDKVAGQLHVKIETRTP